MTLQIKLFILKLSYETNIYTYATFGQKEIILLLYVLC